MESECQDWPTRSRNHRMTRNWKQTCVKKMVFVGAIISIGLVIVLFWIRIKLNDNLTITNQMKIGETDTEYVDPNYEIDTTFVVNEEIDLKDQRGKLGEERPVETKVTGSKNAKNLKEKYFEIECKDQFTEDKYTMYETLKKLKNPIPGLRWYSETVRNAEVALGRDRYSEKKEQFYQISVRTDKFWEECPNGDINECAKTRYNWKLHNIWRR